jgi:hypothetical protein
MPDGIKGDAKLGFGIGIGLLVLGLLLTVLQMILGKVKG